MADAEFPLGGGVGLTLFGGSNFQRGHFSEESREIIKEMKGKEKGRRNKGKQQELGEKEKRKRKKGWRGNK